VALIRHLPEDDNHNSHRRGNLKSYKVSVNNIKCFSFSNINLFS
jgi:hypothetical protein